MKMSSSDLMDLYFHNMGNNGTEPRRFRNNAMFLVTQDRNLESIRESIATMEAADRLLKDPNQNIPEHRIVTLKGIRAEAEKNATTGIQNKWSHLICPGISDNLRWPTSSNTLEHRPLSSSGRPGRQRTEADHRPTGGQDSPRDWCKHQPERLGTDTSTEKGGGNHPPGFSGNTSRQGPAERSVLNPEAMAKPREDWDSERRAVRGDPGRGGQPPERVRYQLVGVGDPSQAR